MKNPGILIITLIMIAILSIACPSHGAAARGSGEREIVVGAGSSLHGGLASRQVLISPALSTQPTRQPSLRLRLEGNLELIHYDGKLTTIAGIAPMIRVYLVPGRDRGLFVEGGVGVNVKSRKTIRERELGGSLIFSPSLGAGYAFSERRHPAALSIRYRHLSNGGLYSENRGFDSWYGLISIGF
ncbi:MAG: acyloxyacyl hydrolase [Syntrophales bacterium]|nr:acyloxyacyl hydrolase [Syntrophales bacterium]MCK9528345.1 acyloxyacyl hydrolase [Syntrophales bacterium]MDX9922730.1 acyloxyacyl hydrolase [Syntrophales bacterium]